MDVKFSLLKPEDSDKLLAFIKKILIEGNSHTLDIYDKKYWEWQYKSLPAGYSKVYIAELNNKIIGYYHVPVYTGTYYGNNIKLAAVQDVAVDQNMRGAGIFRKLSGFAEHDLENSDIDIIYTFPNKKSIHTFLKYNKYNHIKTLDTYMLFLDAAPVIKKRFDFLKLYNIAGSVINSWGKLMNMKISSRFEIGIHEKFTDEMINIFSVYSKMFKIALTRNEEYLNWRYLLKPGVKHYIISLKMNNSIKAVAVFKIDIILDSKTLILMDYAFIETGDYLLRLIQFLKNKKNIITNEGYQLILAGGNDVFLNDLYRIGFIKVPQKINPRSLNLLVKSNSTEFKPEKPDDWRITFSDWDVL
jgi:hypothetical protein